MGNFNPQSMKGVLIGIFALLILVLTIPASFLLLQQRQALSNKGIEPTPATLSATSQNANNGQGSISGYIYHDDNADGQREDGEKPFAGVKIQMKILQPNGNDNQSTFETTTDPYGYFSFRFPVDPANSYLLKVVVPNNYKAVNANPLIIADLKPTMQKIIEFGLTPSGSLLITPTAKP